MSNKTFFIPSSNLSKFQDAFNKLVRRANRIGIESPPSFHVVKDECRNIRKLVDEYEDEFGRTQRVFEDVAILIHHVVIDNPSFSVEGFDFIAKIEHTEEGNIIHSISEMQVPNEYRDSKSSCDHCNINRRRNDTFIVRNVAEDKYLQVGRNCLIDYLGVNAEKCASLAEMFFDANELAEASEGFSEGFAATYDYLDTYLATVAEVIRLQGWRSRSVAQEYGGASTSDIAYQHFKPSRDFRNSSKMLFSNPSENSIAEAKAAIAWAENLADNEVENSDYLHNIRVIARRGVFGYKQTGFAASIVSSYQRVMGQLARKEKQKFDAKNLQYVGEIGMRRLFHVNVDHVIHLPDYGFGTSSLHIMSDDDGNKIIWKSTRKTLEKGKRYILKGTVKKHELYIGEVKQTVLSRCEEVDAKMYKCVIANATYSMLAESEKDFKKEISKLICQKFPKDVVIEIESDEQAQASTTT